MRLPKFEYLEPESIAEALSMLHHEQGAKILAGGTDLLVNMKHRVETPSTLVNIKRIPDLRYIRRDGGATRIGALTSLKDLYRSPVIRETLPAVARASSSVGSYHHQAMGTVGGNLCQGNRCKYYNQSHWWRSARAACFKAGGEICHVIHGKAICYSSYCGDLAPALMVVDARVVLEGKDGRRETPLADLYSGKGRPSLNIREGEILTEIVVPEDGANGVSHYVKFANRESIDFPIVGMALRASLERKEYWIAYTAVDRRPLRARTLEDFLAGKVPGAEVIEEAAGLASRAAAPADTSLYSPAYKRKIMGFIFRDAMRELMERSTS